MDELSLKTILPILRDNIARESHLMTDESFIYATAGRFFSDHGTVQHQKGEYGRGVIHTNTIEGFFSIFKRGMRGVYQHCAKKHLHRYMAEFDFRYSNRKAVGIDDAQRADLALMGIRGKRLTYQTIGV